MDKLALHCAVWDDDLDALHALLERAVGLKPEAKAALLEHRDAHDNTPLLLAYRCGRTRAAKALLAAGAYSKARTDGWEAIQVAALSQNPDLTRSAVISFLAETEAAFQRRLPALQATLEAVPDFQLEMKWSFSSWVPLLSKLLPGDTYSIFKRGSSLRLDTTLLGMSGLRWERGSVSLLLWGRDMPSPGAMYVADNELKTAADARMSFVRPQDVHIQDWVRKLFTQKAKNTDWWSRDVQLVPEIQLGLVRDLFGGLMSGGKKLLGMGSKPRGRLSDTREFGSAIASASSQSELEEDASTFVHVEDPRQTVEDVGVWSNCTVYSMNNVCLRDTVCPPMLPELPLASWWRPEYSMQASDADAAEAEAERARLGPAATAEAPERLLHPLRKALDAIRMGAVTEKNAHAVTSLDDMARMGGTEEEDEGVRTVDDGQGVVQTRAYEFKEYFGVERPTASKAQIAASKAALARRIAAAGGTEPTSHAGTKVHVYVHSDGRLHRPTASVCELAEGACSRDDKVLDARVFFSKDFPITVEQFLPICEVMARTSSHAQNIRRFFETKMPAGAGFPVRFSLPVIFGITAHVEFSFCDASRPIPRSIFDITGLKLGAYVERGFIRQM
jgi:hypothetical protein